ncbi:MAG: GntR family transcriptional regulator [Anaerolineales bacterium]
MTVAEVKNMDPVLLKTREDLVAAEIRAAILRGTFKPGEKLDQQDLADRLRVSRSPVREALRYLDAEGLITLIPNRGAVVTERSLSELEELYYTRRLLEGEAIERSAPRMEQSTLRKLEDILHKADATDNPEELLWLNNEFHMTTFSAYPQPFILIYTQQLRNMVAPYNRLYLDRAGNKVKAWSDHSRIYEACARHDGEAARAATEGHLDRVVQELSRQFNENRIRS